MACLIFKVSQTCYRYKARLDQENIQIADWLIKLTNEHKTWGFKLCFLYLRNIKNYQWNEEHCSARRVYRIYKELELNLRIKPNKRIKREQDYTTDWQYFYNHERPHMSVNGCPPIFKQ